METAQAFWLAYHALIWGMSLVLASGLVNYRLGLAEVKESREVQMGYVLAGLCLLTLVSGILWGVTFRSLFARFIAVPLFFLIATALWGMLMVRVLNTVSSARTKAGNGIVVLGVGALVLVAVANSLCIENFRFFLKSEA